MILSRRSSSASPRVESSDQRNDQELHIFKESLNEEEGIGKVGSESDEALDGLLNAWDDLQNLGGIDTGRDTEAAMQDFINIDDLVRTTGASSLAEMVADVSRTEEESSEGSDNEAMEVETMEVKKPISRLEAQSAFASVRHYKERNSDDPAVFSLTDALDEYFY